MEPDWFESLVSDDEGFTDYIRREEEWIQYNELDDQDYGHWYKSEDYDQDYDDHNDHDHYDQNWNPAEIHELQNWPKLKT